MGLAIAPDLVRSLAADRQVALVSATNGKTTTTRLLVTALGGTGRVATSAAGANLPAGIAAALAAATPDSPAVLEVDEAYLASVADAVGPAVVALLNLSRDQLDRVSEVRAIATRWRAAMSRLGSATVVANADDPLVAWAASAAEHVRWVAAGQLWRADATGCPACDGRIEFGADGGWRCPTCGLSRPEPDAVLRGATLAISDGRRLDVASLLPGRFNLANAAMAAVAAEALGVDAGRALAAMADVADVEGRYAVVAHESVRARLLLAKNPAGWAELLDLLAGESNPVVVGINARVADGHDPSWLWDVELERLQGRFVVATGERARDLAVRLRYARVDHEVEVDQVAALHRAGSPTVDYVGNYTAFQDVRRSLDRADRRSGRVDRLAGAGAGADRGAGAGAQSRIRRRRIRIWRRFGAGQVAVGSAGDGSSGSLGEAGTSGAAGTSGSAGTSGAAGADGSSPAETGSAAGRMRAGVPGGHADGTTGGWAVGADSHRESETPGVGPDADMPQRPARVVAVETSSPGGSGGASSGGSGGASSGGSGKGLSGEEPGVLAGSGTSRLGGRGGLSLGASALRVVVVHPELLGTYGDGGNGTVLAARAAWRGFPVEVVLAGAEDPLPQSGDVYVLGGGEDGPQAQAADLLARGSLERAVAGGAVVLAVCAGFQVVGSSFPGPDGQPRRGLGLLDVTTAKRRGPRAVGELLAEPIGDNEIEGAEHGGARRDGVRRGGARRDGARRDGAGRDGAEASGSDGPDANAAGSSPGTPPATVPGREIRSPRASGKREVQAIAAKVVHDGGPLTGFENHSGATTLGSGVRPLARVVVGVGNDGNGGEGAWSGTVVGTYLHGPVLARNPALADALLVMAIGSPLNPLSDVEEEDLRRERFAAVRAARGWARGAGTPRDRRTRGIALRYARRR